MSINKTIREYDSNGREIYCLNGDGTEEWYDSNGKCIHFRKSDGFECWYEYDSNGNCIHYKTSTGFEQWYWEGELTNDPVKILLLSSQIHSKVAQ